MEISSYFKLACFLFLTINCKKINFYKIPVKIINYLKYHKLNKDNIKKNIPIKELIFIKNGAEEIIYNITNNLIIKNKLKESLFKIGKDDFDFLIFNENNNLVRLEDIDQYFQILNNGYKIKRKLFLSLKLFVKKSDDITLDFNINLKSHNFFIENNKLFDYPFIKWYANKYLNLQLEKDDDYYFIFLDNNIKEYKLNKYNNIIISEDYFTIEDEQYLLE